MVGEIVVRLANTRDYAYNLQFYARCARSRPTFHTTMTRTQKSAISETDVSSKKMKIRKMPHRYLTKPDTIARSSKGGRYAMTALC